MQPTQLLDTFETEPQLSDDIVDTKQLKNSREGRRVTRMFEAHF